MMDAFDPRRLFREERLSAYDFSQLPTLVRCARTPADTQRSIEGTDLSEWSRIQKGFYRRQRQARRYPESRVRTSREQGDAFFARRGPLSGSVLDIGGGFGRLRQWWEASEGSGYIVHDPGVEGFLDGVHESHRRIYERALSLPMTFVEGFGEDLPYKDDVFETFLVVAALDHFADPEKVLGEGHRCLRPGGSLLLLQDCGSHEAEHEPSPPTPRLRERARPILRFLRALAGRRAAPAYHMHHFELPDLLALLKGLGYHDVRVSSAPVMRGLFAFEATKATDPD